MFFQFFKKTQELFYDTVIGFNKAKQEVARVTIEEPTFERPAEAHVNSIWSACR